ncbi:MAG: hypothetical protein GY731_19780 [Gammaproteobacteria bacterium]|nr:hypothetical protein [Gammaproteobacteria bacterium]
MQPLYDEMNFLSYLCKAMKNGEFKQNLGIRIGEERSAREQARRQRRQRSASSPGDGVQDLRRRIAAGKGPLAEIRKSLGMPSRPPGQVDSNDPQ